eukprot:3765-Heterococcus_DN1.PRE.4
MEHIEHTLFSRWASDSTLSLHTAAQIVAWAAHCNQLSDTLLRSLLERGSLRALPLGDDAVAVTDKLLMRYPEDKAQDLEAIELGRAFLEAGALIRKIVTTGGPNLSGCEGIDDGAVKAVSKRCAGLVTLQLRDCLELTGAFLEKLARNCPQLHRLTVDGCSRITDQSIQAFLLESTRYFNSLEL